MCTCCSLADGHPFNEHEALLPSRLESRMHRSSKDKIPYPTSHDKNDLRLRWWLGWSSSPARRPPASDSPPPGLGVPIVLSMSLQGSHFPYAVNGILLSVLDNERTWRPGWGPTVPTGCLFRPRKNRHCSPVFWLNNRGWVPGFCFLADQFPRGRKFHIIPAVDISDWL